MPSYGPSRSQFGSMPSGIYQDYMHDPRLLQGQASVEAGSSTAPVGSPLEGLIRALRGVVGGYMAGQARDEAQDRTKGYNDTMSRALRAGQGQENTFNSATGEWSAPTGQANEDSAKLMARVLASNVDTAPMGLQMQMSDIEGQRKLAQALALDKAKSASAAPTTRTYETDGRKVTQEWVPGTGWKDVGSSPIAERNQQTVTTGEGVFILGPGGQLGPRLGSRPGEKEPPSGPFSGTSMDAQAANILLTGDPQSPSYRAAYNFLAAPRSTVDSQTGDIITTRPDMSAFRSPGMAAPASQPHPMPSPAESQANPLAAPAASSAAAPTQSINVPGQQVTITPGGPGRMTEAQTRDATFADRLAQSEDVLSRFDKQGTDFWQNLAAERAPLGTANWFTTPEYQQFDQAKRDFVNSVLRKESGAVISPSEFANAEKQYFPQPGDSQQVIEQKRRNRAAQLQGMQRAAGPAYQRGLPSKDSSALYNKYGLEAK